MKTLAYIIAALFLFPLAASAQDTTQNARRDNRLTADLQFLTRGEIRDGGLSTVESEAALGDHANFVLGRARLVLDFEKSYLSTKIDLRQTGIWGQAGGTSFNVYEAWAKLNAPSGLFLQAGRQSLSYDDERIIGPNDWAMDGTSHDALKLGFEGCGHKAHLILAYNQNEENMTNGTSYYTGAPGKNAEFARFNSPAGVFIDCEPDENLHFVADQLYTRPGQKIDVFFANYGDAPLASPSCRWALTDNASGRRLQGGTFSLLPKLSVISSRVVCPVRMMREADVITEPGSLEAIVPMRPTPSSMMSMPPCALMLCS